MTEPLKEFYPTEIWSKAKSQIERELSADVYSTWFKNLECVGGDSDAISISSDSDFSALWVRDNFSDIIARNVSLVCGRTVRVKIVAPAAEPAGEAPKPAPEPRRAPKPAQKQIRINATISPRNTFENFVVGESNQFAYNAALAVAQNLGVSFNPLLIYGATGLGKTHLMQAIAHFVLRNNPEKNIVYLSSEAFINDYIAAIKSGNLVDFRQKCRRADVLLIDDIQFFAKKEASQTEFFHTFNDLFQSGKQIVLSCDRPVNEVPDIEQRLVSRFSWGVSIDIQAPDYETRMAILQKKIESSNAEFSISPEAVDFIARHFTKNVRRMEGALTNLIGYATLISKGAQITLEKAQELLSDVLIEEDESQLIDVEKIQKKTAEYFRIDLETLCGKSRQANIALPRQIAMYIARRLTTLSLQEIGRRFGGRNHATVMHAMKTVEEMMGQNDDIKRAVDYLLKMLSA